MTVATVSTNNSSVITKYMDAMQIELNPRQSYKDLTIWIITNLSRYHKHKPFSKMKRDDIITYLDRNRKTDDQDPMHKWIGTYDLYLICIISFFKWFHYPDVIPKK
jgi:hypothetical protein